MRRSNNYPVWFVVPLYLGCLSGCNWWSAPAESDGEEDVADAAVVAAPPGGDSKPPAAPQQKLDSSLKTGDRFPFRKTIQQVLRQPSPEGYTVSRSTLEMLISVTIEEVHAADRQRADVVPRSGQKRLLATFHHVRLVQELPGQPRVEYDSNAVHYPVPSAAVGWHGLKDNNLGFWLSAENEIVDLVGYDQFVGRCLKDVPPEKRQPLAAGMTVSSAAEGVAAFVDESIGALPATALRQGDTWQRERQILQPVPLRTSARYTLRQLTPEIAEIDIQGIITPPVSYGPATQPQREVHVTVRGGKSQGVCRIDRRSGLPVDSRIEQAIEMSVRMADGSEFNQSKTTLTTMQYLPELDSLVNPASPRPGGGESQEGPPQRVVQNEAERRSNAGNAPPSGATRISPPR